MFTEDNYIMWLNSVTGISHKNKLLLLEHFENPHNIWYADRKILSDCPFLSEDNIDSLISKKDENLLNNMVNELYLKNVRYITIYNEEYPSLLKEITDPPLGLYIIGEFPDEELIRVSVVGARRCNQYGAMCCYKLAKDLAKENIVVVSGMAQGIDTMAHKGALDGGGYTIAVLGTGIDICYPASNKTLMGKIASKGCVVSEFPLGTPPLAYNFPIRNRIISALSGGTLVIQAKKRSGTLITVNYALEQGRDVFAVPGNITDELCEGTNALIKEGAFPVCCVEDILDGLGYIRNDKNDKFYEEKNISLAPEEKLVYDCIRLEPITVDEIVIKTGFDIQKIQCMLTMLELKGAVQKLAGQKYIRGL